MPNPLSALFEALRGYDPQPQIDAGIALLHGGDLGGAETAFRQLLAEAERRRRPNLARLALVNLGATLTRARRSAEAEQFFQRALQIATAQGDTRATISSLYNLAWSAFYDRDFDAASRINAQAHAAAGPSAPVDLPVVLALMDGRLATRHGLFDLARQALAFAAGRAQTARDGDLVNQVQMAQGVLEYRAGQRAGLDLAIAGAMSVTLPDRQDLAARWLTGLAYLAGQGGDQDAAQRLNGVAARLAHSADFPTPERCASCLKA